MPHEQLTHLSRSRSTHHEQFPESRGGQAVPAPARRCRTRAPHTDTRHTPSRRGPQIQRRLRQPARRSLRVLLVDLHPNRATPLVPRRDQRAARARERVRHHPWRTRREQLFEHIHRLRVRMLIPALGADRSTLNPRARRQHTAAPTQPRRPRPEQIDRLRVPAEPADRAARPGVRRFAVDGGQLRPGGGGRASDHRTRPRAVCPRARARHPVRWCQRPRICLRDCRPSGVAT